MKVYELFEEHEHEFMYPEEMKIILDYLKAHGEIKVKPSTIESLYCEFSDEADASWLGVMSKESQEIWLPRFAEWLAKVHI